MHLLYLFYVMAVIVGPLMTVIAIVEYIKSIKINREFKKHFNEQEETSGPPVTGGDKDAPQG